MTTESAHPLRDRVGALDAAFDCSAVFVFELERESRFELEGLVVVEVVDLGSGLAYTVCERVLLVVVRVTTGIWKRKFFRGLCGGGGEKQRCTSKEDSSGQAARAIVSGVYHMFGFGRCWALRGALVARR